jgi:hypothetical protein
LTILFKKLYCNCLLSQVIDCEELTQFLQFFWPTQRQFDRSFHILTTASVFSWFSWTKWKKLNDLDAGTKNTKLFIRESPQDNINASFVKQKNRRKQIYGFCLAKKEDGANHGYQNPMNDIQKFHSKNVVEITALLRDNSQDDHHRRL